MQIQRARTNGSRRRGDRAHWIIAALGGLLLLAPVAYWFVGTGGSVPTSGPSMRPTLEGPVSVEVDYDAYDRARPALVTSECSKTAISAGIVALLKAFYGRGRPRATSYCEDDLVACLLRGGLSRMEQTLLEGGRGSAVIQQRMEFRS